MLQRIKAEFRDIRRGEPGRRFLDHYKRTRRREVGRRSAWKTMGFVGAGLVLVICGFVLSLPPGAPGFLLWVPGLALVAARSGRAAILLDRLETAGRRVGQYLRERFCR
jgi:hypothetical protein